MIVYSVNVGHYPTFGEALKARKKLFGNGGFVFNYDGDYTVKLFTTPRKEAAYDMKKSLEGKADVWIAERDTSVNLKGA